MYEKRDKKNVTLSIPRVNSWFPFVSLRRKYFETFWRRQHFCEGRLIYGRDGISVTPPQLGIRKPCLARERTEEAASPSLSLSVNDAWFAGGRGSRLARPRPVAVAVAVRARLLRLLLC